MNKAVNISKCDSSAFDAQLEQVLSHLRSTKDALSVEGLHGSSRAFFLARLFKESKRPIVVFTSDQNRAETLLGDLKYFFRFNKLKKEPAIFPNWELLPYEPLSPLNEVSGERLVILDKLQHGDCPFLIVPLEAALQRVMPKSVLQSLVFPIEKGDSLDRELLETCLVDNGYLHVGLVEDRGEFSVRGDIVDFFPPASINPVRIEFFGDEVESIREFDASSQKSAVQVDSVKVFPVREICLNDDQIASGVSAILEYGRKNAADKSRLRELV
jgi:transcription-repair coupling factor (superfamily II helicase)